MLLLQRWRRVTAKVAARRLSRKSVVTLNRALDEVEDLLAWDEPQESRDTSRQDTGLGISDHMLIQKMNIGPAMTPPDSTILNAPEVLELEREEIKGMKSTESVLERVEYLVKELRKRQEDFKYLHSVVIAKAEEGAQSIMQLETNLGNLEKDFADDQCELTYLKLKLRILEIQGLPYIPVNERDDLAEGIHRWKLDWADVDSRFWARKKKREPGKKPYIDMNSSLECGRISPRRSLV
ncbi:hypothetical protein MMC26_000043 [Xylographa opegraphella]|nr:hypothetical protein [Xylographa opegraphella]